jgi:hypothetical protein
MKVTGWFRTYYDKMIVVAVLVLLLVSLAFLATRAGRRPASLPEPSDSPAMVAPTDVSAYKDALGRLNADAGSRVKAGLFVPGTRVQCADCRKPIPIETYRARKPCPFCQFVPPPPPVDFDGDGDGMWDAWEREHGFDPQNAADAGEDRDGDGFTNLEEFLSKTDPRLSTSTPLTSYLSVSKIIPRRFRLKFTSVVKNPDGSLTFALNAPGRSYFKKVGEDVEGFEIVDYTVRSEKQNTHGSPVTVKVSVLTLQKGDKQIALAKGQHHYDKSAVLLFAPDKKEMGVHKGSAIQIRGREYMVTAIDAESQSVALLTPEGGSVNVGKVTH